MSAPTGRPLDLELVVVALLSLALSASLWWLYFRDEEESSARWTDATPTRRARIAVVAFGYWHYGLVLGVVAVAAGLKKSVGHPYDQLGTWVGLELAVGVALFTACTAASWPRSVSVSGRERLLAAAARSRDDSRSAREWTAAAQLAALTADRRRRARRRGEEAPRT